MPTTYTTKQNNTKKDFPFATSVLDASSQSESLQRKADMANNAAQREEAPQPNNTGMPDNLKSGIESLSGFSMDDVRVHYNSSKPATVQALAYTQGTDIHVAPGQEKHLPHEAWHVAQQMAGRVSPTTNINGMPVNDNAALEHEADVMGEKAIQKVDNKSPQKKESYSNVVQCTNDRVYFETVNDEGCPNSRYYVDTDRYVRIAPINAARNPNQEYHEEERNFLYFYSDFDLRILRSLFHTENLRKHWNSSNDSDIEKIISTARQNRAMVSKKAFNNWSPFDWAPHAPYHPGHPIVNKGDYKNPSPEEKAFYKNRQEKASNFSRDSFDNDKDLMDACFRCIWYTVNETYVIDGKFIYNGLKDRLKTSREYCLNNIGTIFLKAEASQITDEYYKIYLVFKYFAKKVEGELKIDSNKILKYISDNAIEIQKFNIQSEGEYKKFYKSQPTTQSSTVRK
ncbi:MAG: DUF4157 domain-containing protein [Fibrobacter sp.]|nr:DUF4157 domain-containing protein [Fibrobacter sp.]